jgi:predicted acyl esterase
MSFAGRATRILHFLVAAGATAFGFVLAIQAQSAQSLPSETPAEVRVATGTFEYERREVMIAMRDGVRLHTVILVPRGRGMRRC